MKLSTRTEGAGAGTAACAARVHGSAARPRLCVFRSSKGIYAQLIDDDAGRTLAAASTLGPARQRHQIRKGRRGRQARGAARTRGRRRDRSSSTAAATSTTGASRRSPTAPARAAWSSDGTHSAASETEASSRSASSRSTAWPRSSRAAGASRSRRSSSWATSPTRSGIGYGKANEVPVAIQKAVDDAKKNLFRVPQHRATIPHEVVGHLRRRARDAQAGRPGHRRDRRRRRARRARAGRASATSSRSRSAPRTRSTWCAPPRPACKALRRPEDVAKLRGKTVAEVLPPARRARQRRRARGGGGVTPDGRPRHPGAVEDRRTSSEHRGTLRALGLGRIGQTRACTRTRPRCAGCCTGRVPGPGGGGRDG